MKRNEDIDRSDFDPKLCQAVKRDGHQCGRSPVIGLSVCASHGGRAKQNKRKSKQIQIEKVATRLGVPEDVDPKDGILQLISQKAGEIKWYKMKIEALQSDEALIWGKTQHTTGYNSEGEIDEDRYEAKINLWLTLKNEAEAALAKYAAIALRYDIDERRIAIARDSIMQVEAIIRYILNDSRMGVDRDRMALVPELMRDAVKSIVMEG